MYQKNKNASALSWETGQEEDQPRRKDEDTEEELEWAQLAQKNLDEIWYKLSDDMEEQVSQRYCVKKN